MNAAILEKFKHFKLFIKITFESFSQRNEFNLAFFLRKKGT